MPKLNRKLALYASLVVLRAACAFGPGYIHPDEWFQYGEVLSGDYFDIDVVRTWEFDPMYPCRSMASLRLFGLPFALLRSKPSAHLLFATSRLTFFLYSFVIDWSAWQLLPPLARWKGLLLWASSGAVLAFGIRSFSNNIEAAILALCFVALHRMAAIVQSNGKLHSSWHRWSCFFGILISLGIFSRFTFCIFALPLGLQYLLLCFERGSQSRDRWRKTAYSIGDAAIFALTSAILHIIFDTWYFRSQDWNSMWPPVFVPINAALYNLRNDNLAKHGLHPRWLHFVVNAPLILGIGPWWNCISSLASRKSPMKAAESSEAVYATTQRVMASTVFISLSILSAQPHQEPRFLLPLVLPSCILFAISPSSKRGLLLVVTLAQSIAVAIFFGLLHQAGTIPAMLDVHRQLPSLSSTHDLVKLLFWRSFMPPRHLITPINTGTHDVLVENCQSMPIIFLANKIVEAVIPVIIFLPSWTQTKDAMADFKARGLILTPITPSYLHIDTDHLAESVAAYRHGQSLWQSFSYAAYSVQKSVE